jgi:hypothetical protein
MKVRRTFDPLGGRKVRRTLCCNARKSQSFLSVRHLNLKSLALLMGLAILVAVAGCGGGSDNSSTEGGKTTAPIGKSETTKSSPSQKQKAAKKGKEQKKQKPRIDRKQVEKEIRKLADSGQPIPADSPVTKKIIQSLTGNGGSDKKGKKGKNSVAQVIEEVVTPQGGGGGSSSGGGQGSAPSAGVEKILEQIQK